MPVSPIVCQLCKYAMCSILIDFQRECFIVVIYLCLSFASYQIVQSRSLEDCYFDDQSEELYTALMRMTVFFILREKLRM